MIENNEKQTELVGLLKKYAQATLTREKVQSMRGYLQHGDTTTLDHAIAVAYYSLMLDQKWKLNCDKGSLVRAPCCTTIFFTTGISRTRNTGCMGLRILQRRCATRFRILI